VARSSRGAVAVEAAIVLPFLLFLVCGLIDFGRMLNTQVQLDAAAREGARAASIGADPNVRVQLVLARPGATTIANVAGAGAIVCGSNVAAGCVCPTGTDTTADAAVTVNYTFRFVTPLGALASMMHLANPDPDHGNGRAMTARAVMSCVR
jgi:Flp pilus assembly protein TadG